MTKYQFEISESAFAGSLDRRGTGQVPFLSAGRIEFLLVSADRVRKVERGTRTFPTRMRNEVGHRLVAHH